MKFASGLALAVAATALAPLPAAAVPVTFTSFGPLPDATFGGTGIPNTEVAKSLKIVDGDTEILVALSATQRLSNPALTNDGAGTYFATTGSNFGNQPQPSSFEGALWNFNYYILVDGPSKDITDYQFDLYYDFDEAANTNLSQMGRWDLTATEIASADSEPEKAEGSQNLLFGFLDSGAPGFITPPIAEDFDPDEEGEYTFAITVAGLSGGFPLQSVAIDVAVVPEPATAVMLTLASAGLLIRRRRLA
jgi:hypothetical protein